MGSFESLTFNSFSHALYAVTWAVYCWFEVYTTHGQILGNIRRVCLLHNTIDIIWTFLSSWVSQRVLTYHLYFFKLLKCVIIAVAFGWTYFLQNRSDMMVCIEIYLMDITRWCRTRYEIQHTRQNSISYFNHYNINNCGLVNKAVTKTNSQFICKTRRAYISYGWLNIFLQENSNIVVCICWKYILGYICIITLNIYIYIYQLWLHVGLPYSTLLV